MSIRAPSASAGARRVRFPGQTYSRHHTPTRRHPRLASTRVNPAPPVPRCPLKSPRSSPPPPGAPPPGPSPASNGTPPRRHPSAPPSSFYASSTPPLQQAGPRPSGNTQGLSTAHDQEDAGCTLWAPRLQRSTPGPSRPPIRDEDTRGPLPILFRVLLCVLCASARDLPERFAARLHRSGCPLP